VGKVFQILRVNVTPGMKEPEMELRVSQWKPHAVIGREDDCDLVVIALHISRQHAALKIIEEAGFTGLYIMDRSTNGIHVNGRRVAKGPWVLLRDQDKLTFEAENIVTVPTFRIRYFGSAAECDQDEVARRTNPVTPIASGAAALPPHLSADKAAVGCSTRSVPPCPPGPPPSKKARLVIDAQPPVR